jgi:type IV secretion system protein VirD4
LPESDFIALAKEAYSQKENVELRNKAAGFLEFTDETRSIISTAKAETSIFDDQPIRDSLSGSDFDFSELKEGKATVYIILPADYLSSHSKWLRVLVMSALSAMYRRHDGERVLFMLDEFAQLGYLRDLEKAACLATGYGVQLWPFFQDLPQLKALYDDCMESFISNAGIIQVFTPNDMTTAQYFGERQCGSRHPSLMSLPETEQLIFTNGNQSAIQAFKTLDYYKNPAFAGMFDPDPYHKG